jgi:glycosyltransferase involved in cell wall biosynthesis
VSPGGGRVALVCDWFLPRMGGVELHLRDLALALRRDGLDARIVTTTRGPDQVDGVPVHRVPASLFPIGGFAWSPRALAAVGRTLQEERFDVVHAHASVVSPVAYAGALAGARAGLPSLITFHSMLHRSAMLLGASEALLGWSRDRIVLSAVSSVVAAQAAHWMAGASVGVLPNGIDVAFWRQQRHDPPDGEVVVVTAMRLSRKKRALELVRAFADASRFVAGAPPLRLVIAGDGPDRLAVRRLAAELGIGERVTLAGQLSREALRALYATSHVFVLPSERESFGIAALEARAAGLPVVAMLASGARDFIRQGENGLLARDSAELSRFIARLALDASFRRYIAHRNAATAPPYDWVDVVAQHRQLYGAAASLGTAGRRSSQP